MKIVSNGFHSLSRVEKRFKIDFSNVDGEIISKNDDQIYHTSFDSGDYEHGISQNKSFL